MRGVQGDGGGVGDSGDSEGPVWAVVVNVVDRGGS